MRSMKGRSWPTSRTPVARALGMVAVVAVAAAAGPATAADRAAAEDRPAVSEPKPATAQAAQVLTWTADNSTTAYRTAPVEAEAGPTTVVFENSEATGNTTGMQHTLTFDTITDGYNHDVDLDILAYPSDENNGRWEAEVVLTEGTYRYFCSIPGHGQMQGELVVTDGGDPGDDTTPPEVSAAIEGEQDENGDYVGSATVSLSATDEGGSGVDTIEYQLDDTGWQEYSEPVQVTEVGDHMVQYRATDGAGNTSDVGSEAFAVVEDDGQDTTPPEVEVMLHGETNADGAYLGSAEVMLQATDDESGVDSIEYRLDDGGWQAYAEPFTVDEIGDHVVDARATDAAGNVSDVVEKPFTVVQAPGDDTTPPEVSATVLGEQDADWNYIGSAAVEISASDDGSGVETVEYRLDGGEWQAYEEPVTVDTAGDHTADYRATDAAGNVSEVGSVAFSVVPESPAPECAEPDPSPTVVMGDVGSGVRNREADGACTIDDLILDEARWVSHADFVAHAREVVARLLEEGIVTGAERGRIVDAAKRSDVGRNSSR
jgi:plastocyanin